MRTKGMILEVNVYDKRIKIKTHTGLDLDQIELIETKCKLLGIKYQGTIRGTVTSLGLELSAELKHVKDTDKAMTGIMVYNDTWNLELFTVADKVWLNDGESYISDIVTSDKLLVTVSGLVNVEGHRILDVRHYELEKGETLLSGDGTLISQLDRPFRVMCIGDGTYGTLVDGCSNIRHLEVETSCLFRNTSPLVRNCDMLERLIYNLPISLGGLEPLKFEENCKNLRVLELRNRPLMQGDTRITKIYKSRVAEWLRNSDLGGIRHVLLDGQKLNIYKT